MSYAVRMIPVALCVQKNRRFWLFQQIRDEKLTDKNQALCLLRSSGRLNESIIQKKNVINVLRFKSH